MISKQVIDEIKRACEAEAKYQYTNIEGKKLDFATYIKNEISVCKSNFKSFVFEEEALRIDKGISIIQMWWFE